MYPVLYFPKRAKIRPIDYYHTERLRGRYAKGDAEIGWDLFEKTQRFGNVEKEHRKKEEEGMAEERKTERKKNLNIGLAAYKHSPHFGRHSAARMPYSKTGCRIRYRPVVATAEEAARIRREQEELKKKKKRRSGRRKKLRRRKRWGERRKKKIGRRPIRKR